MKIDTKVRTLGAVDHRPLKSAVANIHEEAWAEDTLRQQIFSEIHNQTRSIILLFMDHEAWPSINVTKRQGWDYFSKDAQSIVNDIVSKHYRAGGVVIRAMIANLMAGGTIVPHTDTHPSFAIAHRVHVPLITNDLVDFRVGGESFHLQEGVAYEINNLEIHGVFNRSKEDRLHFIFDYVER